MSVTRQMRRADALYYDNNGLHRRELCERVARLEALCRDLLAELGDGASAESARRAREMGVLT